MRRAAIALSACLLALAPCAAAAAAGLKPAFGNAIVSTHPDGRQAKLWLDRDGTYSAQGRRGERSDGVWKLKGEKLCLSQKRPIPIPFSYCKAFPRVHVGSTWSDTAFNGDKVTNRLVRGR